jgi:hypothetical protein
MKITTKFLQAVNSRLSQKTTKKTIQEYLQYVPNGKCLIKDREEIADMIANMIEPKVNHNT